MDVCAGAGAFSTDIQSRFTNETKGNNHILDIQKDFFDSFCHSVVLVFIPFFQYGLFVCCFSFLSLNITLVAWVHFTSHIDMKQTKNDSYSLTMKEKYIQHTKLVVFVHVLIMYHRFNSHNLCNQRWNEDSFRFFPLISLTFAVKWFI